MLTPWGGISIRQSYRSNDRDNRNIWSNQEYWYQLGGLPRMGENLNLSAGQSHISYDIWSIVRAQRKDHYK